MMTRIEDYGLIGDGKSAALVRRDGSIDWLCWPRFDSPACFASLIGAPEHGCWQLVPADVVQSAHRRYVDDTLILETDYRCASGSVRVVDFMPTPSEGSSIIRQVIGLSGSVRIRQHLALRFDYGRIAPWVEARGSTLRFTAGSGSAVLTASVPVTIDANDARSEWTIGEGQTASFVLACTEAGVPLDREIDPARALDETRSDWRDWIGAFDKPTEWPVAVRRSLLVLRALIYRPSGAIIAAPTTSLPEIPGGDSNWDYRFCWLRDMSFTLSAWLNAGFPREAERWRDWLFRTLGAEPEKLCIAYRADGSNGLDERELDWLPGFNGARPVRVGNAAWKQHQVDTFGELLDALAIIRKAGLPQTPQGAHTEAAIARHLEAIWDTPGQGLWEDRGEPKQYVYSKVMAWVGIDCYLRAATDDELTGPRRAELERLRSRIHADVCARGYDEARRTFVQHYGGTDLDASLLLLPVLEFLPIDDPRIAGTIAAVERELMTDGFVMRTKTPEGERSEGAFLACTCWLADCRILQGRHDEARVLLDRVCGVANDLGLLSEEYDLAGRHLSGNFPQALTHLSIVNTALAFSGPVVQRGGG